MQGKYKKMNSGKYLYKISGEKKAQINKKVNVRKFYIINNYFIIIETAIKIY
jgi:hypothetical protein